MLLITVSEGKPLDYSRPLKLCTDEDTRFFHCNIKTLNLIPNIMASENAKEAGCDESIFYFGHQLTECAHSALLLKDGRAVGMKDPQLFGRIQKAYFDRIERETGLVLG